jgi:hypothetical protein
MQSIQKENNYITCCLPVMKTLGLIGIKGAKEEK